MGTRNMEDALISLATLPVLRSLESCRNAERAQITHLVDNSAPNCKGRGQSTNTEVDSLAEYHLTDSFPRAQTGWVVGVVRG